MGSTPTFTMSFKLTLVSCLISIVAVEITVGQSSAVDCKWDQWTPWSACTKSCDKGTSVRTRTRQQEAEHGGANCSGSPSETKPCNKNSCNPQIENVKFANRECEGDKVGSYQTIQEAWDACSSDRFCKGIYDDNCDGQQFYLCPPRAFYNWHRHSCIINKANRGYWLLQTKIVSICCNIEVLIDNA